MYGGDLFIYLFIYLSYGLQYMRVRVEARFETHPVVD